MLFYPFATLRKFNNTSVLMVSPVLYSTIEFSKSDLRIIQLVIYICFCLLPLAEVFFYVYHIAFNFPFFYCFFFFCFLQVEFLDFFSSAFCFGYYTFFPVFFLSFSGQLTIIYVLILKKSLKSAKSFRMLQVFFDASFK